MVEQAWGGARGGGVGGAGAGHVIKDCLPAPELRLLTRQKVGKLFLYLYIGSLQVANNLEK